MAMPAIQTMFSNDIGAVAKKMISPRNVAAKATKTNVARWATVLDGLASKAKTSSARDVHIRSIVKTELSREHVALQSLIKPGHPYPNLPTSMAEDFKAGLLRAFRQIAALF